jgi:uncharacterized protein YjiK
LGESETQRRMMRLAARGIVLAGIVCVLFTSGGTAAVGAQAQPPNVLPVREAQVLSQERTGVSSPVGLAFSPGTSAFYVVGAQRDARAETDVAKLTPFSLSPVSDRSGSATIAAALADPINIAFDATHNRLLLLGHASELLEVRATGGGDLDPQTLRRRDAARFGLKGPQGMAVDPSSGTVFILAAAQPRIVRIEPASDGSFEAATISEIDLQPASVGGARGLAFDPSTGHLHVGSGQQLIELTQAGEVIATRDLSSVALTRPQGMVFAPSGDLTDAPSQLSLYVADSGSAPGVGQIMELSLAEEASIAAVDFSSQLVRTVDMGALSPPSPDPSGITYVSSTDRLLIVDGEVEETVQGITHFQGANVWELRRNGLTLRRTANISTVAPTVVPMTNEPVGAAFNSANGHYFVSDDNAKRVYDLNPGADGLMGTSDDTWTFFSTVSAGNGDPEGVAYNASNGRLYVADGVNREVYEYTTSGTLLGHFDTAQFAVQDPESVEVNSQTGTLFVLSNRQSNPAKIIETTTGGGLLQTIDVSAAGARKPAGLAYANASNGSGVKRFYIVDRGVDNNSDPNAVDGKLYEMTTPGGPPVNNPPVITSDGGGATAARSVPENQTAVTDVNASDADGDTIAYSISGGADAARFAINSSSGVLTFVSPPDFENPTDVGGNNVYDVVVRASDGSLFDEQAIAVTVTDVPEGASSPLYFTLLGPTTVGGIAVQDEDVVFFNGSTFSLAFDGSDVGITSLRIDAFARLDATRLLFSFDTPGAVPGIAGTTDDSDIVLFTATSLGGVTSGTFSMYFHGADVGLTTAGEDVDAVELLGNGRILISTLDIATVSGVTADDEDLMRFTPTQLGPVTAGTFFLYFDGTDVDLIDAGEDVDAAAVGAGAAQKIHLSAVANFSVTGAGGADEDVFVFTPTALGSTTAGTYSPTLYFDGSAFGLAANDVSAIDLP